MTVPVSRWCRCRTRCPSRRARPSRAAPAPRTRRAAAARRLGPGHARRLRPGAGRAVGARMLGVAMGARHRDRRRRRAAAQLGQEFGAERRHRSGRGPTWLQRSRPSPTARASTRALDCSGHPDARLAGRAGHPDAGGAVGFVGEGNQVTFERQPGSAPAPADAPRLVDLQHADPGGVRAVHRQARACRSSALLTAPLPACSRPPRPTGSSTPRPPARASSSSTDRH